MITFGPLLQLQLYGTICPCFQKSEDANAHQAIKSINATCKRVRWIRENASNQGSSGGATGFLGGMFAKAASAVGSSSSTSQRDCIAHIILHDSANDSQPEIFVDPLPEPNVTEINNIDDSEHGGGGAAPAVQLKKQTTGYKLNIKLRRVDKVSLDESTGQIILYAKPVVRDKQKMPPKELLRFVVLLGTTDTPITQDERNLLVHHLMVISEWERQRRSTLSVEDQYESDDEDDDGQNFLTRRAAKATHFARREIELQQTKRDREQRKAKLIQEAGGLKYTAMAMANRDA